MATMELSLDRKYRPINLEQYVGNAQVKRNIHNLIENKSLPKTCLFEGERGTGKTTIARLIAKEIFCLSPNEDGSSCGECKNCKAVTDQYINKGEQTRGLPIYEMDMTKLGTKDATVQMVSEMKERPLGQKYKVYILDEVQRMSPEAQNSLLKISEEPPSWLYIFMCTTDPDDLIIPLKSRYRRFRIRKPTVNDLSSRLEYICREENIKYEESALKMITRMYERIPRESINALETLAKTGDEITYKRVVEELQTVSLDIYVDYFQSLGTDIADTLGFIDGMFENYQVEYPDFIKGLSVFIVDAFNCKLGVSIDKYSKEEYEKYKKAFEKFTIRDIIRVISLTNEALKIKNHKFALVTLSLKIAYPDYFEPIVKEKNAEVITRENQKGFTEYQKNKKEYELSKLSKVDINKEMTEQDILGLFEDSFLVEED